jgi:hypothetical protein
VSERLGVWSASVLCVIGVAYVVTLAVGFASAEKSVCRWSLNAVRSVAASAISDGASRTR